MKRWNFIFLLCAVALFSCKNNDGTYYGYKSFKDSVNVTEILKNPYYERFNYQAAYQDELFYLLVEGFGDFYAIDKSGNIMWSVSLNKTSGDPNGMLQLLTSTHSFFISDNYIYFVQSDFTLLKYDLNGNLVFTIQLPKSENERLIQVEKLPDNHFAVLVSNYTFPEKYDLFFLKDGKDVVSLFKYTLPYFPGVTMTTVFDDVYLINDLDTTINKINLNSQKLQSINIKKSPLRLYDLHPRYDGDPKDLYKMTRYQRAAYLNDGYKSIKIVGEDIYVHQKLIKRDSLNKGYKDLVSINRKGEGNIDVKKDHFIINLDNYGNYFFYKNINGEKFLNISPLDESIH